MIIHAGNDSVCDALREDLEKATGRPVDKRVFRAVILSHAEKEQLDLDGSAVSIINDQLSKNGSFFSILSFFVRIG